MRLILLIMWTAFQSFILRDNYNNDNNNSNNNFIQLKKICTQFTEIFEVRITHCITLRII